MIPKLVHYWYGGGDVGIYRSHNTGINIVDSYTPTGNETASWAADANGQLTTTPS